MKIAFFTNTILEHGGGLEKYFIESASFLVKNYPDAEVTILTFDEKRTEWLQRILSLYYLKEMPISNIYREELSVIKKSLGRAGYQKCTSFKMLKKEIKKYNVIYSKNEILDLGILWFLGYKNLPPVIAGIHTPIFYPVAPSFHAKLHNILYTGFLYKALLGKLAGVHVTNESNRLLVNKLGYRGRIQKIFNPYSGSFLLSEERNTKEMRVLFVGRLSVEKGVLTFLECAESLLTHTEGYTYRFRIAGQGDADIEKRIKELVRKYPESIEYLGHVSNSRIQSIYAWSNIILVPSHFETANYVVLEAGAAAKVVLASDIPGPQDLIEEGVTGYLLKPETEYFLAQVRVLTEEKQKNPDRLITIGLAAQAHVRENFTPEKTYPELYQFLCSVKK